MTTIADQLAEIEQMMVIIEREHRRTMRAWQSLRRERDVLRAAVAREDAALDRQARKWCGPDVRRSA